MAARVGKRQPTAEAKPSLKPVLLVEDSSLMAKMVKRQIEGALHITVEVSRSLSEAQTLLTRRGASTFCAAVVDLELPDASGVEIADLTIRHGLPTLVLAGSCDVTTRERLRQKEIVDYFLKDERGVDQVIATLKRLRLNQDTTVLLVDDSKVFRRVLGKLLRVHRFDVVEAYDGQHALEEFQRHPNISMVLTDYEMPYLNGVELVQQLRSQHGRDELAIIGLSTVEGSLTALFLKHGADDFLNKSFEPEEFYCRIYRSLETLEHIQAIKRAARTDLLTGLPNRLDFFQRAPDLYERAVQEHEPMVVAMIDIDHFKAINDTYGHAGGDVALQHLSTLLQENLEALDVVARFGGEEFCCFSYKMEISYAQEIFEELRKNVEASLVQFKGEEIRFTLSIGVTHTPESSLDAMINRADLLLYEAKTSGRNRVVSPPKLEGGASLG
ncbi:MAG: diguanylate cyclase [Deltaproteobacteria bacterium]|nr:diguanylate cyclase [Deltaproteobacteria bacterium]